jgi:hypothetical protein
MFRLFNYGNSSYWPVAQEDSKWLPLPGPPHIDTFGSAEVVLADGMRKAPDQNFVDSTPGRLLRLKGWPTVVFEVAWTQMSNNLAEVCGQWIAASCGKVNLAVGIDIIVRPKEENNKVVEKKHEDKKGKDKKGKQREAKDDKKIGQLWVSL